MSGNILFSNNDITTLAGAISPTATSATLAAGTGALFPAPTGSQFFCLTFVDAATRLLNEIVHVTSRTGDVITIVRAQEGTAGLNWLAGDYASGLVTAGSLNSFTQDSALQNLVGAYAIDSGTANAVSIALTPPIVALSDILGSPLRIRKVNSANTGVTTVTVNALTAPLKNPNGSDLWNGELPGLAVFSVTYDGTEFVLQSLPGPIDITLGTSGNLALSRLTNISSSIANAGLSAVYEFAGNPNGSVAGSAASSTKPPDMVWDRTNNQWWVCVTTGSTSTTVWQRPSSFKPLSIVTIVSSGAFTQAVPAGASQCLAEGWGGGGGGGFGSSTSDCSSGGSGGAYGRVMFGVTSGTNVTGSVGATGAGSGSASPGGAGGSTTITYNAVTYTAGGGPGGLSEQSGSANSPSPATATGAWDASIIGQQGFPGLVVSGIVASGAGGGSPLGGLGGVGGGGIPSPGTAPGGGGGGSGAGAGAGGGGGAGSVRLTFY